MAEEPVTMPAEPAHMDPSVNRRNWRTFLKASKWFALHVLAITFWLIFVFIGHMPWFWTGVVVILVTFAIGALFH